MKIIKKYGFLKEIERLTPEKIAIIGSGQSSYLKDWPKLPIIRFNTSTFSDDFYDDFKTSFLISQGLTYKKCRHLIKNRDDIDNHIIFTKKKITPVRNEIYISPKDIYNIEPFKSYFRKTSQEISLGFISLLWLNIFNIKEIYLCGFDGWMCNKKYRYKKINKYKNYGEGYIHNLNEEWNFINRYIEKANSNIHISKSIY